MLTSMPAAPSGVEREDLGLAAFLVLPGVESTIHAAVVDRPGCVTDGRLADELTALVLGYLSPGGGR
ncbi:hypothetical protein GBA63_21815 (plasmid) [Rubrobacter tropicus]|uniref:Tetracyclin repressor SlmA-like C-terminal domain-containing protein n=1 Tax=Rubrobacter tropicus TaxID=2653851 RepID=A0A6G8QFR6_9ACTN|nr:hypothetical protein [Rubrobacter tropicus]QIN85356.1 hypothetical protein GBA63_21815 [Rubrobacter tropicus]